MTKYDLDILDVMDNKKCSNHDMTLSIKGIIEGLQPQRRRTYQTTFRHVMKLKEKGYIQQGLNEDLAGMYFITEAGQQFRKAHHVDAEVL